MPRSISGIGTAYCGYAAAVNWNRDGVLSTRADHDAIECVIALFLPLWPRRAFHSFDWNGDVCRAIPIRRTPRLLLRAMLRPYTLVLLGCGGWLLFMLALVVGVDLYSGTSQVHIAPAGRTMALFGAASFLLGAASASVIAKLNARDRDIRLVLGRHELGSSDPSMWTDETLAALRPTIELLGAEDESEAAREALRRDDFGRAMYAARLAVARGREDGERITDEILDAPRVREVLSELRRRPWRREELLGSYTRPPAMPLSFEPGHPTRCHRHGCEMNPTEGALFYDGRTYCNECLDAVGGPGFAELVRREPVLVRPVPNGPVLTGILVALCMVFLVGVGSAVLDPRARDRASAAGGGAALIAMIGYIAYRGRRRKAWLEGRALLVGGSGVLPLDSIRRVRPGRWIGIFPILIAESGPLTGVRWPRGGEGSRTLGRAVVAAIGLREPLPPGGASPDGAAPP